MNSASSREDAMCFLSSYMEAGRISLVCVCLHLSPLLAVFNWKKQLENKATGLCVTKAFLLSTEPHSTSRIDMLTGKGLGHATHTRIIEP